MFGHYFRNLDDKNRIIVPSKFRDKLVGNFYATLGPDKVLEIRDSKKFKEFSDKLLSNNMLNQKARKFARILLGNTEELTFDKQGRINLPSTLLQSANITSKELVFVGVGTKIEIWGKQQYDKFTKSLEDSGSIDDLAKQLLKDGAEL